MACEAISGFLTRDLCLMSSNPVCVVEEHLLTCCEYRYLVLEC
jgi:predicted anti-sigma-YlaC factor YlaD